MKTIRKSSVITWKSTRGLPARMLKVTFADALPVVKLQKPSHSRGRSTTFDIAKTLPAWHWGSTSLGESLAVLAYGARPGGKNSSTVPSKSSPQFPHPTNRLAYLCSRLENAGRQLPPMSRARLICGCPEPEPSPSVCFGAVNNFRCHVPKPQFGGWSSTKPLQFVDRMASVHLDMTAGSICDACGRTQASGLGPS
ncbi:hypothetical protein GQ53DRAFT_455847 [Thozetella sp. PMI_491]|nr:hypothetical protein GQ53DRAFT_455847 [Thozetella sp. PMI_491]